MELLKQRIRRQGRALPGGVIQVDAFLNHQIDPMLADAVAEEFVRRFQGERISKVLTVEASGIAFGILVALRLRAPLVFAKKRQGSNQGGAERYTAAVRSYTKGGVNTIGVSREYLSAADRVLVIDDFMAMGEAAEGLCSLVSQAGAELAGVGVVIEKGFQPGGDRLRARGIRVEALARIPSIGPEGHIRFDGEED